MRRMPADIGAAICARFGRWLAIALGTILIYYTALLAALVVRFETWPNYVVAYDWLGNVAHIVRSTPSLSDTLMIARDEWLLEVGYMNMSFGRGISEWSLTLVPPRMAVIAVLGALLATVWALAAAQRHACGVKAAPPVLAASGLGAGLIALTGATLSWVVCCSTPTWIVGLAMLGMGVATANWLEPAGPYLTIAGFTLLGFAVLKLARGLSAIPAAIAQTGARDVGALPAFPSSV